MTYEELSAQVALLGSIENDPADPLLLNSVNLALRELYTGRVITRTVRLIARGLTPVLYHRQVNCANGGPFQVDIPGYAYSFRIQGNCQMMTIYPEGSTLTSISTGREAKTVKALATPETTLRFFGTYSFSIYDFSVYDERLSDDPSDIPEPGGTVIYDLHSLYGDYMSFYSPATDGAGERLTNCILRDGVVEIDSSYNGEIVLTYRRLPNLATGDTTEEIDVPDEYLHLFPLLVASYMLLDGNDAMAKYYRSLYEDNAEIMDEGSYRAIDTVYKITDGWA